ncbi:hypothetical protein [Dactylosporangium sp. NPDC005555]|uniref:hypothetical protein n=1 Tax=Dactylosporangium sp. NPDC005555 TaxID=3154889 RepID=UPI0033B3BD45
MARHGRSDTWADVGAMWSLIVLVGALVVGVGVLFVVRLVPHEIEGMRASRGIAGRIDNVRCGSYGDVCRGDFTGDDGTFIAGVELEGTNRNRRGYGRGRVSSGQATKVWPDHPFNGFWLAAMPLLFVAAGAAAAVRGAGPRHARRGGAGG